MGALHAGHISLVEASKKENSLTICSIFVNPTQFNDPGDFEKYPITIEKDIEMLEEAGCDVLFLPDLEEIYPRGSQTSRHYELGYLETVLEGKFRPGHFQGVCMVVERLLEIVKPAKLYLGQKDYQQCMVIKKLISLMRQKDNIIIKITPTLREPDGLAMSSRNMRLNTEERKKAISIYETLSFIKQNIKEGNLQGLKQSARELLETSGFRIDYVEIARADDLSLVNDWDGKTNVVALIAAFSGEVRLIDNMIIHD
jgi:pantoate--beta-alanine ligase